MSSNNNNNNNNKNNNKNNKNKTPDFRRTSENKIYTANGRKKDYFGNALSLYDDVLVVGAYSASPYLQYTGALYVFNKNFSSIRNRTTWNEVTTLVGSEALPHDSFGSSISIWEKTILVGAYLDDLSGGTSSGAAYIFEQIGDSWTQTQRLVAPDAASSNFFGFSTALCDSVAVIGAHGWATQGSLVGAAYVFRRSPETFIWDVEAKIVPTDVQEFQMFAYSVATAPHRILIGAYGDRTFGTNTGAAYVFAPETVTEDVGGNITTYTRWVQTAKLRASNPQAHSYFGISTAMYYDSRDPSLIIAVVGASMATGRAISSGAAYVFHGTLSSSGAYVWTQRAKLVAFDGASNDFFGSAVASYGNVILVGAKEDSVHAVASGSAYLFSWSDSAEWSFQSKIWANDSSTYDDFGVSVALWGDIAVVGADRATGVADQSGCAYVFSPGLVRPLFKVSNHLTTMSEDKLLLIMTFLPLMLIALPILVFGILWALNRGRPPPFSEPTPSHSEDNCDSSRHSVISEVSYHSKFQTASSGTQSSHGLVSHQTRSHVDRLDPRSNHRGVIMTASGGSITPMVAEQLRHSAVVSRSMNADLFS